MEEIDDTNLNQIENQNDMNNLGNYVEPELSVTPYQKTINSHIDPNAQGEVRLMSLEEKLKLDVPGYIVLDKIDESMNFDITLYIIKDFLMMLILLLSSSLNFNYLYFPFILVGLIYNCLILENKSNSRRIKFILEIIIFIYSFLLIAFKTLSLFMVSNENDFYLNNKDIFINLGISYLICDNENEYYIFAFLGEGIVFLFSLAAIIINKVIKITDEEIESRYFKKLTYNSLFTIMKKYLFTCYFVLSGVAVFNKSVISLIYILPLCFLLFLFAFDVKKTTIYNLFRTFIIILLYLLILEILLINVTNIYSIALKYFLSDKDFLLIWRQIGFYFAYDESKKLNLSSFEILLEYPFRCLSVVTFSLCIKAVSKHELQIAKKNDDKNENEENKDKKGILDKFYDKLAKIWSSPFFILHICRILAIIWLYYFRNFYSIGVFIWLFFSFLYLHIGTNRVWTTFVLIPCMAISLFCIHISKIDGIFEFLKREEKKKNGNENENEEIDIEKEKIIKKYFHFALSKYNYDYLGYIFLIIFYFFANYLLHTLNEFNKSILKSPVPAFVQSTSINDDDNEIDENGAQNTLSIQDINMSSNPENTHSSSDILASGINLDNDLHLESKIKFEGEIDKHKNKDFEDDDENISEEEKEKLTLKNIIVKNIFGNIDKITLIAMYLVTFKTVNMIHFVFLLLFMIQLLFPDVIRVICVYVIQILQIFYLIEYIMDLLKVYKYESFKNKINNIKFCLPYDEKLNETSVEILIYFIVYCFYTQYQLNNYKLYQQLVDNEKINLTNYIHKKFPNSPFVKEILFFIGSIIINMYVWLIILLFIFFSCYFEVNLIFGIKLGCFLLSLYFLMLYIQDPKNSKLTLKSSRFVLIYSAINTLVVYIYQLLCHPLTRLKDVIDQSDHFLIKNFPNIGFTKYDESENQLYIKLLPHFFTNFLSLLFVFEMKRTIKVNKKMLSKLYTKKLNTIKKSEEEIANNETDNNENEQENKVKKESPAEKYEKNRNEMTILEIKNFFFNIIMMITKFYWLFLFMTVCILFTTHYLTFGMIIYLIIFGLTFIFTFLNIIKTLDNFIKKDSYFISKVIRYSLIEVKSHIRQSKYARKMAFRYLFGTNCIYLFIFYLFGVFYLFEEGCNRSLWIGCDENHMSFFSEDSQDKKELIISISYLFGFYVKLKHSGLMSAAWADLLLFCFIAFDVYIQKLENYFTELSVEKRKRFKILANENIKLRPLSLLGETNILANIEAKIISNNMKNKPGTRKGSTSNDNADNNDSKPNEYEKENEVDIGNMSKKYYDYLVQKYNDLFQSVEKNISRKVTEKFIKIGRRYILQFLEAFKKAAKSDVKLSEANNKYKIIKGIKQVFEEIIIFLLICTAISKLNIWSFIYMIFSLFLILTKKSMKKYYILFSFIIFSIILQNAIFVSNIRKETDPGHFSYKNDYDDDIDILEIIKKKLGFHWYTDMIDDKNGFFLGLGVNRMQINLMWMDYIEAIILYIYLDFFSYSIYQDVQNKGKVDKGMDKINYYNLHLNPKVKECVEILSEKEYKKHYKCMKYDFNIDIGKYEEFKDKILLNKPKVIELKEMKSEENDIRERYNSVANRDVILDIMKQTEASDDSQQKSNRKKIRDDTLIKYYSKDEIKESPLLAALEKTKKIAKKKNLMLKSIEEKDENTFLNGFKKMIYLSLHNVILIIIMIISMMVSGLLSIFYISFSLIFLMKSNSMYVGDPYLYPKSIKTVLRVAILVDIAIQTLYQTPYINPGSKNNTLYIVLKIIGFNKIIHFGENFNAEEFEIAPEQMILVLAKAFTYFFMSLQILIYSSQDFQEYYLSYLLTKNLNLRRISLMNVFRFNNKRIEVMGRSIALRKEMENSMILLQKRLESWNKSLSAIGSGKIHIETSKDSTKLKDKNHKKEEEKEKNISNMFKSKKTLSDLPEISEEKNEDEKPKGDAEKKLFDLFGVNLSKNENEKIGKNEEEDEEEEEEEEDEEVYVPEKIVKEKIKSWIFGRILIKIQLWLHKKVASYTSIDIDERDVYEKELIQGRTTISSMLETMVEMQLNTIDLSKFTSDELIEVKKYFDGTREKELIRLKNEREKMDKFKKTGNQIIAINQLKKEVNKGIEGNKGEINEENKNKRNSSFYENMKIQEEENHKNAIDTTQPKFKELEKFTSNELFVKYLKTSYILGCIATDIIAFCSNQFHWLCYIMMLIDHACSPSILSLFYPFSIFCYAILEYPRPKKTYWKICLLYTVILIAIKFVVQLELFVKIFEKEDETDASGKIKNIYQEFIDNIQHFKLGLIFFDSTFSLTFFNYIVYDALVIICLLINNYLLVSKGIWIKREQDIETIYQAMERIALTKHLKIQDAQETKAFNFKWLFGNIINKEKNAGIFSKQYSTSCGKMPKEHQLHKKSPLFFKKLVDLKRKEKDKSKFANMKEEQMNNAMKPVFLEKYNEKERTYYQRLFPNIRNEKPGNEYYPSYTITMLVIIIYIVLFYTNMNQDKTFGSVSVDTNQFSSSMVIFLIIHVIFLVYDRIIYISQNRNNLTYDYIIYDKKTCAPITVKEFSYIKNQISLQNQKNKQDKQDKFFIPFEYIDKTKDKYNIVYMQIEEFNCPLLQKYILHLIITVFSHLFVFFYLPMRGNYNIANAIYCIEGEDCNDFVYNPMLIIFYILYIVYLIGSGLQVKYGFYDLKRKSLLKSGNSSINGGIYAAYKAIPFLYEIKLAIDWTFTSTCLDLFQWNKFEGVYDTIYATYCSMTAKNVQLVGQKVKKIMKIGMGGTLSFALILLLVIPLMLFSSLNPTNELNNLLGATLTIDLSIFYHNGAIKNYTLFENSKPQSIKSLFPGGETDWKGYKYSESIETKNFPQDQIQKVQFFKQSDRNWGLTKPHILNLINTLEDLVSFNNKEEIDKIYIVMEYIFERPLPAEAKKASNRIDTLIYDESKVDIYGGNETGIEKLSEIKDLLLNCNKDYNVTFNEFYSVPLRLTANLIPGIILDEKLDFNYDVTLGFIGCEKEDNDTNYLESYFTLEKIGKIGEDEEGGLVFHVFSDKVSSSTSGYSVLTFYVSFVLLAGTYVRNFFSGQPKKIILTELPNPEAIINLCEGVLVSRYSFDYEQEEKLYYILIELMRSPDYLKILTESSTQQFQRRRELTIKEKDNSALKFE